MIWPQMNHTFEFLFGTKVLLIRLELNLVTQKCGPKLIYDFFLNNKL